MKQFYLLFFLVVLTNLSISAQKIISLNPEKRPIILEEYTGVNCGWCPDGHKKAQAMYDADPFNTVLINVHAGSFANPSAGQPDFRTTFGNSLATNSGVTGYPSGTVNRHKFDGATTAALDRGAWSSKGSDIKKFDSPVNVGVQTTFDEATRELTVNAKLYYTGNSPAAKNFIHVAFMENGYIGWQTDYTSGNKSNYEHNHILRHLITGQWGAEIATTTQGTSHDLTYKYTVPAQYDINKCDVAVFVSETKNEIYSGKKVKANGGRTLVLGDLTTNNPYQFIGGNTNKEIVFKIKNELPTAEPFQLDLTSDLPLGWTITMKVDENVIQNGSSVMLNAEETKDVKIVITSSTDKGLAKVSLTMQAVNYPEERTYSGTSYLLSEVKDLIISHVNNVAYVNNYQDGMGAAENTDNASIAEDVFFNFIESEDLTTVKNIYYNLGWSFPGLSVKMVEYLSNFMDNGGNLFIAGQDLGWDTWDATGSSNHAKDFYTNYLKAKFISDGAATTKQFIPVTTDPIFGSIEQTAIDDAYGGGNVYPEVIQPLDGASAIFKYEGNIGVGGIRAQTENGKVVYLGINLEQMNNLFSRYYTIKQAHDWFYGIISSNEDIEKDNNFMIYPNPTASKINISNEGGLYTGLELNSADGKLIASQKLVKGQNEIEVDQLVGGTYFIKLLTSDKNKFKTSKIQLVK